MSTPAAERFDPVDHGAEPVARSGVTCVQCEYELAGLAIHAPCPECGLAVLESVRSDLLRFTPPWQLEPLRLAATMFLAAMVFFLLAAIAFVLFQVGVQLLDSSLWLLATMGLSVASSFSWLFGAMILAKERSKRIAAGIPLGVRVFAAAILLTGCVVGFFVGIITQSRDFITFLKLGVALTGLSILFVIGGTIGAMRAIAERFPNASLATTLARGVTRMYVAGAGLVVLGLIRVSPPGQFSVAEGVATLVLVCIVAALIGMTADAVLRWTHGLQRQARHSARLWRLKSEQSIAAPPVG